MGAARRINTMGMFLLWHVHSQLGSMARQTAMRKVTVRVRVNAGRPGLEFGQQFVHQCELAAVLHKSFHHFSLPERGLG